MQQTNSQPQQPQQASTTPVLVTQQEQQRAAGVVNATLATPSESQPTVTVPPEVETLNNYMQATYGVDLSTAMQYVQSAQQQQQAQAAPAAPEVPYDDGNMLNELQQLKSAWQVDDNGLHERMQVVATELAKLPEAQRPMYDTVEGAQLLWQKAEMAKNPPPVERATLAGASTQTQKHQFTRSQINNMSEADYRRNDAAITYAEANNLIFEDI